MLELHFKPLYIVTKDALFTHFELLLTIIYQRLLVPVGFF